ncbi:hypothetical protein HZ326_30549, partial [Fusarium oxysporum f. sp. albedinis]
THLRYDSPRAIHHVETV